MKLILYIGMKGKAITVIDIQRSVNIKQGN